MAPVAGMLAIDALGSPSGATLSLPVSLRRSSAMDERSSCETRPGAGERPHAFAGDPAVGGDVVHAVEAAVDGQCHRRSEVVEVEELRRRLTRYRGT